MSYTKKSGAQQRAELRASWVITYPPKGKRPDEAAFRARRAAMLRRRAMRKLADKEANHVR